MTGQAAIGDQVNLAARIEGLTRVYRVCIRVAGSVKQSCEAHDLFRFVDRVVVKGDDLAVSIDEPLAALDCLNREQRQPFESWTKAYDEAFAVYQRGDWEEARRLEKALV